MKGHFMDSSNSQTDLVEQLADEFAARQRRGERPLLEEYVLKYPELASEIREVFPALVMMERVVPAASDLNPSRQSHDSLPEAPLQQIGDYRILRELGRGGMGVVYEAEQESLGRRVALKVLPREMVSSPHSMQRFQREARAAARMHHTNIVPVFEVGRESDIAFYAMQLIQGQGLDLVIDDLKRLRKEHSSQPEESREPAASQLDRSIAASLVQGSFQQEDLAAEARAGSRGSAAPSPAMSGEKPELVLTETIDHRAGSTARATLPGDSQISTAETNRGRFHRSVAQIGKQAADALAYAHARGIIHRDIKPSNLILDVSGVVWITDFGLAKTGDEGMTHTGDILGTMRYMSPERFSGKCDVRADIYALGLTLYELLILQPAFESPDQLKLIEMIRQTEPRTPRSIDPRIPRDLETIVLKACDRDPRRRYQSADELADDLQRFIRDEPIRARRISLPERLIRWSRRNRSLAASLATVSALLLVINIAGPLMYWQLKVANARVVDEAARNEKLAIRQTELAQQKQQLADNLDQSLQDLDASLNSERKRVAQQKRDIYAGAINQVRLEAERGNVARMQEILLTYLPARTEDDDLRGPEWYYWWHYLHQARVVRQFGDPASGAEPPDIAVFPGGELVAVADGIETRIVDLRSGDVQSTARTWLDWNAGLGWNPMSAAGQFAESLGSPGGIGPPVRDLTVKVWDASGQQRTYEFPKDAAGHLSAVAISPDGRRLAAVGGDSRAGVGRVGKLWVWNADTGELIVNLEQPYGFHRLQFNDDGTRIAVYKCHAPDQASSEVRDVLVVFELTGESEISARKIATCRHDDYLDKAYFIPHSKRMLLCAVGFGGRYRKELYEWTIPDGHIDDQRPQRLGREIPPDFVQGAVSPDGRLFAFSGIHLPIVWLIDTQSGEVVARLHNDAAEIRSFTFSPKGDRLIASVSSGEVVEWNIDQSEDQFSIVANPLESSSTTVDWIGYALSPDQSRLAIATRRDKLVTRELDGSETKWADLDDYGYEVAFSPTGRLLVCTSHVSRDQVEDDSLCLFDMQSGKYQKLTLPAGREPGQGSASAIMGLSGSSAGLSDLVTRRHWAFTADERELVVVRGSQTFLLNAYSDEEFRHAWDIVEDPATLPVEPDLRRSADSKEPLLAVLETPGDGAGVLRLRAASTGELLHETSVPIDVRVLGIVAGPSGRHAGLIRENGHIEVWDVAAGRMVIDTTGNLLLFSPDGSRLATMTTGVDLFFLKPSWGDLQRCDKITLWDLDQHERLSTVSLAGDHADEVRFSPDGQRILTLHGRRVPGYRGGLPSQVRLWDVLSGHEMMTILVDKVDHYKWNVAVDDSGERLMSFSLGKWSGGHGGGSGVRIWDFRRLSENEDASLAAATLVDARFEQLLVTSDVVSSLEADETLRPQVREAAITLARQRSPEAMASWCLHMFTRGELSGHERGNAMRWAEAVQRMLPGDPRAAVIVGGAQLRCGRPEEAIKTLTPELTTSHRLTEESLAVLSIVRHAFLALAQLGAGREDDAETESLRMYQELQRRFSLNLFLTDMYSSLREDLRQSHPELEVVLEVKSTLIDAGRNALGIHSPIEKKAGEMMKVFDTDFDGKATREDDLTNWDEARKLDRNGDGVVTEDELARSLTLAAEGLDDSDPEVARLSRLILQCPTDAYNFSSRSVRWAQVGEYDRALADFDEAIRLDPDDRSAMSRLANYLAWGLATTTQEQPLDPKRAVELAETAVKLDPGNGACLNTLGVAHYRAGDFPSAISALEQSMELANGGSAYDWFFLAMAQWQLGDKEHAREWYGKAVTWTEQNAPNEDLLRFRQEADKLFETTLLKPE